jgi:hypothetical protein
MALKPADGRASVYIIGPIGAALIGTLLTGVDGFQYDAARGLLTIHLETVINAGIGLGAGIVTALGVYIRWAIR